MKTILRKAIASLAVFSLLWSSFASTAYAGFDPQPQIDKKVLEVQDLGNDQYSVKYEIRVSTIIGKLLWWKEYTLIDTLSVPSGVTASVSNRNFSDGYWSSWVFNPNFDGQNDTNIISGEKVSKGNSDTFTYTVTYTVGEQAVPDDTDCKGKNNDDDKIIVRNDASVGGWNGQSDQTCEELESKKITFCHVPPWNPDNPQTLTTSYHAYINGHANHELDYLGECVPWDLSIEKSVGQVRNWEDGQYSIPYTITVTNNWGTTTYTLTDSIEQILWVGVSVSGLTQSVDDDSQAQPQVNSSFDWVADQLIIDGEYIIASWTDTYTYTVDYTVSPDAQEW